MLASAILLFVSFLCERSHGSSFEPYELNGGLVAAIAGEGFTVLASDTRLSSGYEILSRRYLSGRIWTADVNAGGVDIDGMLTDAIMLNSGDDCVSMPGEVDSALTRRKEVPVNIHAIGPIILSAGCAADCEGLRRQIRAEVTSHLRWNGGGRTVFGVSTSTSSASSSSPSPSPSTFSTTMMTASSVATLLGNTLYERRGFPFYSFCIVAGLEIPKNDFGAADGDFGLGSSTSVGVVYVFDAIGSHERVAVASAGTGREMLQPILDRLFAVSNLRQISVSSLSAVDSDSNGQLRRDGGSISAERQCIGLRLAPPVQTHVSCTAEEAVTRLVRAYRSVAEREIAVGDEVIVCVLQAKEGEGDNDSGDSTTVNASEGTIVVLRFPLKKH